MKKLLSYLAKPQHDKLLHYFYGSLLALLCLPFIGIYSAFVVAFVALAKELWDSRGNGTVEFMDVTWTMLGGVTVIAAFYFGSS